MATVTLLLGATTTVLGQDACEGDPWTPADFLSPYGNCAYYGTGSNDDYCCDDKHQIDGNIAGCSACNGLTDWSSCPSCVDPNRGKYAGDVCEQCGTETACLGTSADQAEFETAYGKCSYYTSHQNDCDDIHQTIWDGGSPPYHYAGCSPGGVASFVSGCDDPNNGKTASQVCSECGDCDAEGGCDTCARRARKNKMPPRISEAREKTNLRKPMA
jgi:hypothetical protein